MLKEIKKTYFDLRKIKKNKYNRSLSFGDYFTDRQERADFENFGKGTTVYDNVLILGDVKVGKNTWIGPFTILDGSGILIIGSNCSISSGVQIYTHDTIKWAVSGGESPYEYGNVIVEDNCYIGPNSIIEKGVIIKSGTIVGANSYVNKCFPKGSKIAGNPAKQI